MSVRRSQHLVALAAAVAAAGALAASAQAGPMPYLDQFNTISTVSSAVPANGDQNPYGVAVVRRSVGDLHRGDVLVSDFNNGQNFQGTGSSVVEISPSGAMHVFATVPRPPGSPEVGLTTALVVLRSGYVIVGNLPAPGGMAHNAQAGALTVLDPTGHVVETLSGGDINGPWDMTAVEHGHHAVLFVTNVLNGTVKADGGTVDGGTVVRITLDTGRDMVPMVTSNQVIGTGFDEHTDPAALVVGPTGVGLGRDGTLYVADSVNSRLAAIPDALTRTTPFHNGGLTVSSGGALNDPLGLTIAPGGDIITANGADGRVVETTPAGNQVATKVLMDPGAGDLFGLAIAPHRSGLYFVNDVGSGPQANSLDLLH